MFVNHVLIYSQSTKHETKGTNIYGVSIGIPKYSDVRAIQIAQW